jgi:beta-glucanase (GH16 family)
MKNIIKVSALCLILTLLLSSCFWGARGARYTSARMKTQGKQEFTYGRIEASIKVPKGQGIWPAFWMLGASITSEGWPRCGEIDIMEHINTDDTWYGTIHWDDSGYVHHGGNAIISNMENWHIYRIDWTDSYIRWFVDGTPYYDYDISGNRESTEEFHAPFFIILNVAVGGNWPKNPNDSTVFPQKMYVAYVRYYRWTNSGDIFEGIPYWQDEFNGTSVSADWVFETGNGQNGWGNNELENYTSANATVSGGNLVITADKEE